MLDSSGDAKETRMSKVESLEQEIRKLSPQELAELRTWFLEYDAEVWDRQIEEDARAGRLDRLGGAAGPRGATIGLTGSWEFSAQFSEDLFSWCS